MDLTHEDVLEILGLIDAADVEHFELRTGDTVIVTDRASQGITATPAMSAEPAPASVAALVQERTAPTAPVEEAPVAAPAPAPAPGPADGVGIALVDVTAPVVGVFYRSPEPGAPPFAQVGDRVEQGTTLGLVEVMKMFTSVTAPAGGVLTEVLVGDGEFVEYEQTLMRLRPDVAP